MRQLLLQNATTILLQNAPEVYYKMRRLLQIATAQTSFLQIFLNILKYIWWSLLSIFLFIDIMR